MKQVSNKFYFILCSKKWISTILKDKLVDGVVEVSYSIEVSKLKEYLCDENSININ